MSRLIPTALLASGLFAFVLVAGGCQSDFDSADLRSDWTPELHSLTYSDEQFKNYRSRHRNNTYRQVRDDWAMIWLEDKNMGLTKFHLP